jgi:Tfp pilus assembly protein PilX
MATANAATTYLENKILDFLFKNNSSSFASPGNSIYIGLATAVSDAEAGTLTEVSTSTEDANYTRQQVTAANWTLTASSTDAQTVTNANNIEYSASSGVANYTVTHAFVADASTGGNILFVGALDVNKTIQSGDIFRINSGNLTIELK